MWQTFVLSFLAGLMLGNGLPHFVRGITRKPYPSTLGNGPVPNLVAGWASLVLGGLLLWWADLGRHPELAFASVGVSVLLIGLFHAGPGAFPRAEAPQ
ncbi:hypothetical protein ACTWP5_10845 [Streptomyces sp. 4N509B]|uniref:hypothetical protein n=1 Tax=Streptomyces sp. 4N509B TaxID=3457413 RepID=UPI003FD041BF